MTTTELIVYSAIGSALYFLAYAVGWCRGYRGGWVDRGEADKFAAKQLTNREIP